MANYVLSSPAWARNAQALAPKRSGLDGDADQASVADRHELKTVSAPANEAAVGALNPRLHPLYPTIPYLDVERGQLEIDGAVCASYRKGTEPTKATGRLFSGIDAKTRSWSA